MKSFLVIQTASIGDVILATSVVEKLHESFPDGEIDFLIKKGYENLFAHHPFIHELIIWNKNEKKYRNLFSIFKKIRAKKYDVVVDIQRYMATGFITAFSGAKEKIGFNKNPFSFLFTKKIKHVIGDGRHEIERNQALIEHLSGKTPAQPRLYPSQEDYETVKDYKSESYICVAPWSLWFTKTFPEDRWVDFLDKINEDLKVFVIGGKSDLTSCQRIMTMTKNKNVVSLVGKLSLLQSAALMRDAKMNFVNDSSPLHLAEALDAPVTAIFCSTTTAFGFGPLSTNRKVVEVREKLPCRPCGLHGYKTCPKKHFKCAYSIDIQELLDRIN